ncbi:D-alanyl-D-alanine carboxypeptidase family protein [Shouchella clausii]|nr:D-alanyl-D-alanine carboxypeptidase family protein [Shouchella clausii]MDO7270209.1 D-alanyl-D-alanine carboxypeptidase family protein [Shouchella clausii]MDO7289956.1 D-alanyl-D-alanine carboxypeptidase family protein [Shouchella clausii]
MKQKGLPSWTMRIMAALAMLAFVLGPIKPASAQSLTVDASAAIVVNADTGQILFEQNSDEQLAIASMTKMMTEYIVLESIANGDISWEDEVTITDHLLPLSHQRELSNVPLRQDYTYTVKDLYESMAIYSANASTMALAEHVAGTEAQFVAKMNEKAEELGLEKYEFINASGLNNADLQGEHPEGTPADGETTLSARSVAQLAYHLLKDFPEVLDTASVPEAVFDSGPDEKIDMQNWNWMLPNSPHYYEGVDGLKTGYTDAAGNSFTATAERDGVRLITVVMGTDTRDDRFNETKKLLDYGFSQFEEHRIIDAGTEPEGGVVPVARGKEKEVQLVTNRDLTFMLGKGQNENYSVEIELDESKTNENGELVAPLEEGETVGTLKVIMDEPVDYLPGSQQSGIELVAAADVEEAGWFTMSMRGIGGFFSNLWSSVSDTISGWFS